MLAAPRPEPVRKAQKVLFPDLVEYLSLPRAGRFCLPAPRSPMAVAFHRLSGSRLFVTVSRDSAPRWIRPCRSASRSSRPSPYSCHVTPSTPAAACLFRLVVAAAQQIDIHVVQQGGEPHLPVPLCCLPYTVQPAWPALPARCPVRVRLFRVLLGQRPSLHDLLRPSLAFVRPLRRYYAVVRLPAAVHLGLIAHRLLPPIRALPATDGHRVSRFSRVKFPCMPGVFDSAGPVTHSRYIARPSVAFRLA